MERVREHTIVTVEEEQLALLYIRGKDQPITALRRAAERVRRNIRRTDTLLVQEKSFAVLLAHTSLIGAQAALRRLEALLVDIDYDVQIVYGTAARLLMERMQAETVFPLSERLSLSEPQQPVEHHEPERAQLPYLAFLAHYPSHRLLHMVPYELANRYHCIPVGVERGVLTLATHQPLDRECVALLCDATQRSIFQIRCEFELISDVLRYWERLIVA